MTHDSLISQVEFSKFVLAIKNNSVQQVENIILNNNRSIVNQLDQQLKQPAIYFAALIPGDDLAEDMIRMLIINGANIKFEDQIEQTVLFYVCREGKQKCAQILLNNGLSLDKADVYGQTPLFYAASENRLQIVRRYATKQRVNHIDNLAGQTPLYYAARRGHLQMCQILIEKGADICMTDTSGKTAVQYAKRGKFYDVADYLNHQYKKYKDVSKLSFASQSIDQSNVQKRKKKQQSSKQNRQPYKIVFLNEKGEQKDLTQQDVRTLIATKPQLQNYFSNPQTIPQQILQTTSHQTWNKVATKIVTQLCKLKGAFWFQQPVDPVKYNIMDYFDIISRPMDFSTVKKKLQHNCYTNANDFVEDINLIWYNCYKYNGQQHDISKSAKQLQLGFSEYVRTNDFNRFVS